MTPKEIAYIMDNEWDFTNLYTELISLLNFIKRVETIELTLKNTKSF